ncbi:MAG TPA: GGDEF domain-containing protein, partial [Pyrinomonadaceae bacterium]|nr:GGDEF domain-containing protein [Pyrinomonadaceae bacterium]
ESRRRAEAASEMSMTDALTGLLNRYGLQRALQRELAESRRYARALSCLLLDLDHFKSVNDTYGHAAGDAALAQAARGFDGLTAVLRRMHFVVLPFEPALDEREVDRLVVGDEDDGRAPLGHPAAAPRLLSLLTHGKGRDAHTSDALLLSASSGLWAWRGETRAILE